MWLHTHSKDIYIYPSLRLNMPGKNRFQLLRDILLPYDKQLLHVERIRLLLIRNMGTSGTTINNHLRFASESRLLVEEEHLKFRVHATDNEI